VDLVGLAKTVEERMLPYSNLDIHVAVMGCEVKAPVKRARPILAWRAVRESA
jgi:hypothetical protein